MKRTREDLEEADRVSEQQVIKPSPAEKSAISAYCTLSLQVKKIEEKLKERVNAVKPEIKGLRSSLLETIKKGDDEILQIPQTLRKNANVPPYIRLVKNNKDLTITPEVISEALQAITDADVLEAEGTPAEILINSILSSVRRIVRSFSEQVKLTESVPRGIKAADIPFADEELSKQAIALHEQSSLVLTAEAEKRTSVSAAKSAMIEKQPSLEQFFERSGITHQRVMLENKPFNLCRRLTVSKTKVTFKLLQTVLETIDIVKTFKTKQDILDAIKHRKADIHKAVAARIATLPNTSKSIIHLQRVNT
jgi:hypothetical protein